jgi:hypothetical protein
MAMLERTMVRENDGDVMVEITMIMPEKTMVVPDKRKQLQGCA